MKDPLNALWNPGGPSAKPGTPLAMRDLFFLVCSVATGKLPCVGYSVFLEDKPTLEQREAIFRLLEDYNCSKAGPEPERPLAIVIRESESNKIIGGLWGLTYYGWMFVELLFVPEHLRRQGLGRRVMLDAESEAMRRRCHGSWIDTFTFQAPEFYEKLGYEVFGTICDYPPGHSRLFMCKRLGNVNVRR